MPEAPRISADELKRRMQAGEEFVMIDVRNPKAWATSDVKARNAIRVSLEDFEQYLPRIPKSKPIVTYCT
jgi:rhodanese-related sulfurtransferase